MTCPISWLLSLSLPLPASFMALLTRYRATLAASWALVKFHGWLVVILFGAADTVCTLAESVRRAGTAPLEQEVSSALELICEEVAESSSDAAARLEAPQTSLGGIANRADS